MLRIPRPGQRVLARARTNVSFRRLFRPMAKLDARRWHQPALGRSGRASPSSKAANSTRPRAYIADARSCARNPPRLEGAPPPQLHAHPKVLAIASRPPIIETQEPGTDDRGSTQGGVRFPARLLEAGWTQARAARRFRIF